MHRAEGAATRAAATAYDIAPRRLADGRDGFGEALQAAQCAAGGEVATHAVHAAARRGRGRADEEARVRRRVGIESGYRAGEELPEIGDTTGDRTADVVRILTLEIRRTHRVARQNAVAEAGREALDLALDRVGVVGGRSRRHVAVGVARVLAGG